MRWLKGLNLNQTVSLCGSWLHLEHKRHILWILGENLLFTSKSVHREAFRTGSISFFFKQLFLFCDFTPTFVMVVHRRVKTSTVLMVAGREGVGSWMGLEGVWWWLCLRRGLCFLSLTANPSSLSVPLRNPTGSIEKNKARQQSPLSTAITHSPAGCELCLTFSRASNFHSSAPSIVLKAQTQTAIYISE